MRWTSQRTPHRTAERRVGVAGVRRVTSSSLLTKLQARMLLTLQLEGLCVHMQHSRHNRDTHQKRSTYRRDGSRSSRSRIHLQQGMRLKSVRPIYARQWSVAGVRRGMVVGAPVCALKPRRWRLDTRVCSSEQMRDASHLREAGAESAVAASAAWAQQNTSLTSFSCCVTRRE